MVKSMVATACVVLLMPGASDHETGDMVVTVSAAPLQAGPKVLQTVPRGAAVPVEGVEGAWLLIHWEGVRGYVNQKHVIPLEQGIAYFSEAIHQAPTAEDLATRASLWNFAGEPDRALQDVAAALGRDPRFLPALVERSVALEIQGDLDEAVAAATQALAIDPRQPQLYVARGALRLAQGEVVKSLEDCTAALRIDPRHVPALSARGHAQLAQQEWSAAIADFDAALAREATYVPALAGRAEARVEQGEFRRALADYAEVLRLEPENAGTHCNVAWLLATSPEPGIRDGAKAIEHARRAAELMQWKDAICLDTLAAAYAESKDFASAVEWQEQAVELAEREDRDDFRQRLDLYLEEQPYREGAGTRE
jgi:tetratricopeptide (TPR) repeat protein